MKKDFLVDLVYRKDSCRESPKSDKDVNVEKVSFESGRVRIVGELYIPNTSQKFTPAVCISHGIPSPVKLEGDRGYPALAEKFCENGFLTLIFNFRGTGLTGGKFDYLGWPADLRSAISFLHRLEETDKNRLAVVGFSGGAVVAIYVAASDERVKAVVACACPTDMRRLGEVIEETKKLMPEHPPSKSPIESAERLSELNPLDWMHKISPRPLLIMHGEKDELVDVKNAYKLFAKAGHPKEIRVVPRAPHRLRLSEEAVSGIIIWLKAKLYY